MAWTPLASATASIKVIRNTFERGNHGEHAISATRAAVNLIYSHVQIT